MREGLIAQKTRIRSNAERSVRAKYSNSLESERERSCGRFEFVRFRELAIANNDLNSLKCVRERSPGIFEFARMREGVIACTIRIHSKAVVRDRAGDLNSLESGRERFGKF